MARGGYKLKRGGGRNFSKHLVLDENGTAVAVDRWGAREKRESDDGSEEEEKESEEESDEESDEAPVTGSSAQQPELSRTERKEIKKKKALAKQKQEEESDEDEEEGRDPLLANPNIATKKMNIADLDAPRELSRRERDEKEKKEAKERYWKLHEQGKTDQAKADLARLAKIRAERDAAQAKRKAETEAKGAEVEAKRKEAAARGKRI